MKESGPLVRNSDRDVSLHDGAAAEDDEFPTASLDARVQDLVVGAFLAHMGPTAAPEALVERSVELVRREVRSQDHQSALTQALQLATGLGWAMRGPALALNGDWVSCGALQTVQGLGMARYAFGTALLSRESRPKARRGWVGRLLRAAGGRR